MTDTKICALDSCKKSFTRKPNSTNHNWRIRRFCSSDCQKKDKNLHSKRVDRQSPSAKNFKLCTYKNHEMHISAFVVDRNREDGLSGWCKACKSEYMKKKKPVKDYKGGNEAFAQDMQRMKHIQPFLSVKW